MILDAFHLTDRVAIALCLASPASAWVTGVMLRVDGGTTKPTHRQEMP